MQSKHERKSEPVVFPLAALSNFPAHKNEGSAWHPDLESVERLKGSNAILEGRPQIPAFVQQAALPAHHFVMGKRKDPPGK